MLARFLGSTAGSIAGFLFVLFRCSSGLVQLPLQIFDKCLLCGGLAARIGAREGLTGGGILLAMAEHDALQLGLVNLSSLLGGGVSPEADLFLTASFC